MTLTNCTNNCEFRQAVQRLPSDRYKDILEDANHRAGVLLKTGSPGRDHQTKSKRFWRFLKLGSRHRDQQEPWSDDQKNDLKVLRRLLAQTQHTCGITCTGETPRSKSLAWLARALWKKLVPLARALWKRFVPLALVFAQVLVLLALALFWMKHRHGTWIPTSEKLGFRKFLDLYLWVALLVLAPLLMVRKKPARNLRICTFVIGSILVGVILYKSRNDAADLGWKFIAWPVAVTIAIDLLCYLSVRRNFKSILAEWTEPWSGRKSKEGPTRAQRRMEEQTHINALLAIISVVHVLLVLAISYLVMLIVLPPGSEGVPATSAEAIRDSVFVSVALVISSCIAVGVGVYSSTHARLLETRKEFRSTVREIQRITYELDRATDHLWKKFKNEFAASESGQWKSATVDKDISINLLPIGGNQSPTDENQIHDTVCKNQSPTDENQIHDTVYKKMKKCDVEKIVSKFQSEFKGRFENQWKTTHENRSLLAEQCKRAPVNFHDFCEDLELFDKLFRYLDTEETGDIEGKRKRILSRLHLYASTYVQFDEFGEKLVTGQPISKTLNHPYEAILHSLCDANSAKSSDGGLSSDHPAHNLHRLWIRLRDVTLEADDQVDLNPKDLKQLGNLILILELTRNRGPMLNWFRASLAANRRASFQYHSSELLKNDHFSPQTVIGLRLMPTTSLQWSYVLHKCGMPDRPESAASQRLKVMSLGDISDSDD